MTVRVQPEDFDVGVEIARLRQGRADIGAVAAFIGLDHDVLVAVRRLFRVNVAGRKQRQGEQQS